MRKFIINVNGNSYEVEVEEVKGGSTAPRVAQTAPQAAPVTPATAPAAAPAAPSPVVKKEEVVSAGQTSIEAPMPGSILRINVKEGETVKSGQVLLILEAMKMENEIISPVDGKVVSIPTPAGSVVNAGDKMIIIG